MGFSLASGVAATTAVVATGALSTVGTSIGILGGGAGLIGTYIALRANARAARREYQQEITDAEARGAKDAENRLLPQIDNLKAQLVKSESDMAWWRSQAHLAGPPTPPPTVA